MQPSEYIPIKTTTLEKLEYGSQFVISSSLMNDINVRVDYDELFRNTIIRLRSYMWAEKRESHVYQWPADWWQAFKERWFTKWMKARWLVRYEKRQVKVYAAYPDLVWASNHTYRSIVVINENPNLNWADGWDACST